MLTVNGVIGTWAGPDEPGTAYVMLHHSIGDVGDGHLGSWGFQQGGMGAVSDSIRRSAESFGCEIRTDAKVKKILVRGGKAVGVALENGEELRAPVVVTTIHPKIAFLDLLDRHELPADFVCDIERWKTRSGVVKINVALSELPDFTAMPGKNQQPHHTGSVELCFSPQYAERAFQDAHIERKAARATVRGRHDPDHAGQEARARGRARLLDVHAVGARRLEHRAAPRRAGGLRRPDHRRVHRARAELQGAVIDRQVIGPYDMEQDLGLIGGNIFHGELSVDQLFHMRPAPGYADFRTPIARPVPRLVRHARRWRRERDPRLAGVQARPRRTRRLAKK